MRGNIHLFGAEIVGVKHDLRDTVTITQINEKNATVIAVAFYPTVKSDRLSGVSGSQITTRMRSSQLRKWLHQSPV
jgi:hypothetical protein